MAEKLTIITVGEGDSLKIKVPEGDPRVVRNTSDSMTSRIFGPVGNKVWPPGGEIAINAKGNLEMEVPKGTETMVTGTPDGGKVIKTVDVEVLESGKLEEEEFERRWYQKTPGTRKNKTYISSDELKALIPEQLEGKFAESRTIAIADEEYYCPPLKDAESIIAESGLDCKKWMREAFDCDDFAHVLKAHFAEAAYAKGGRRPAHCFGIVWMQITDPKKSHALNWMVNDDQKLRFVEPQTGRVIHDPQNPQTGYAIHPQTKEKLEIKDISLMLA